MGPGAEARPDCQEFIPCGVCQDQRDKISGQQSEMKKSYDKPRQRIKKQRCYFADKGLYSQNYSFSSSHVQMCELDHKDS